MSTYPQTATWPPKKPLSDTEAIIDHIRQQERARIEREHQAEIEADGVHGVRSHLANVLEEAERIDDFPQILMDALKLAYNLFWVDGINGD